MKLIHPNDPASVSPTEEFLIRTKPDGELHWMPVAKGERIRFNGTSYRDTYVALIKTFGRFPIRLEAANHLQVMNAMANAAGEGGTPYREIFDALNRYGSLEIQDV